MKTVLFLLPSALSYLEGDGAGKTKTQTVLLPNVREYPSADKVEEHSLFMMKIYVLCDIWDWIFSVSDLTSIFTKSEYKTIGYQSSLTKKS